ncbi:MAG TPA: sigma-70 family RNA polymerase sigma factor [Chitinophagaceae bacterium]|nr:sigma-70 family RNA polymerase sigma factor [Chitinophagaceae bacterium]HMZ46511.1 sigma-70 family RNA polymerase sigma factor [Chitinophagaceae bacterium]HNE93700.1 sigma-70 family RNA polymerase sigma factor [Chitinophagaceae bacterium]HNJ58925.1 sigma-70 family RNA polymerase sigma factor [Chitinophagaceae bacterium]HNL82841.1 sigma-70 family RNA polymerase sigma factor [Chitinophagaceae bacterium]
MKAELNEELLLKGLAENNSKAIETIYKQNFNIVQAFILNNNGSYDEARDIFQEAMITLYEKVQTESFVLTCKINTYVYSVCRRLWLKRLQQLGRYSNQIDGFEETLQVEDEIEAHERKNTDFAMMEKALNSIGEPCRTLLESFYIKKIGMQELAKQFGYTNADNAKTQKYKCLLRLKKIFFAQYKMGE